MTYLRRVIILACLLLTGCTGLPDGIEPVKDFDLQRYMGRWYEIARLDHSFERELEAVTAEYSVREDGGIRVINTGRNSKTGVTEQAEGRAYFDGESDIGHLKVSFFGPFFSSYVIFDLISKIISMHLSLATIKITYGCSPGSQGFHKILVQF